MKPNRRVQISVGRGSPPKPLTHAIVAVALGALSFAIQSLLGLPLPFPMAILIVNTKVVLKR